MSIRFLSGVNVDSNTLFVDDANNRVGIGTASPEYKLHLVGGSQYINGGQGGVVNSSPYTSVNRLIFNNDYNDIARGPNKITLYDGVWLGGFGVHDNTLAYYSGGVHNWYQATTATNAVSLMTLTSTGSLGIGTTSPSTKLHVAGGSDYNTTFSSDSNRAGWVINGPGTATPRASALVISSDSSFRLGTLSYYHIIMNTDGSTQIYDSGGGAATTFAATGNVGIGTTAPYEKLDIVGNIRLGNYTDAGTKYIGYANNTFANQFIAGMSIESTALGGNYSQRLNFATHYYGVYAGVRMTLDEQGRLGIGTTTPKQKLIVEGTLATKPSGVDGYYSYLRSNWSQDNAFELGISEDGASIFHKLITSSDYYFGSTLQFWTSDTEKMRITSAGNVGIGTTSPATKFHTVGYTEIDSVDVVAAFSSNNANKRVNIGYSTSGDYGFINAVDTGNVWKNLVFSQNGGNVGIGTTSPNRTLDVNGVIRTQNSGSAGAPSIEIGTSAQGNGFFYPTTNTIAVTTNDNERMRITSAGNVGIGTTSPSYMLDVSGSIRSAGAMEPSTAAWIDAAFTTKVGGSAYGGGLALIDGTAGWAMYTTGNGQYLNFSSGATSGGVTARMRIQNNGALNLSAYGSGTFTGTPAYNLGVDSSGNVIELPGGVVDGSGTANYVAKWSDANTLTDSVVYDNGTSVGIGTASPNPYSWASRTLTVVSSSSNSYAALEAYGTGTGAGAVLLGNTSVLRASIVAEDGSNLLFATNTSNSGSSQGEKMRITAAGNVGIGTTSPNAPLHIIKDLGTSVSAVARLRGSNSTARTTRLQFEDYNGTLADGLIDFVIPTAGSATGARLDIGVDSAIVSVVRGGNVGIGTTSPGGRLHIATPDPATNFVAIDFRNPTYGIYGKSNSISGRGNTLEFTATDYNTNGSVVTREVLTLRPEGNVGIGTTAPGSKLSVSGSNSGSVPLVDLVASGSGAFQRGVRMLNSGMTAGDSIMYAAGRSDNSKNMGQFYFYYAGDGSNSNRMSIGLHSVDDQVNLMGTGNLLIGTTTDNGNKLRVQGTTWISDTVYTNGEQGIELAWTGNTINDNRIGRIRPISTSSQNPYAGGLAFDYYKYDGAAYTFFEGMRLNGSGNVGIGTAAPEQKLHVQGSGLMATLQNSSTAADGYTQLEFKAGNRDGYIWLGNQNTSSWAGAGGLNIYTANGNMDLWTGAAQRIRIMNAGNVLINTTTDAGYKLDVNGTFRSQGTAYFGGNVNFSNQYRTYGLPYFEMGGGGITDEYLLLVPKYVSGTVDPYLLMGELQFQRGSTSTGNDNSVTTINIQTAYNQTNFYQFSINGATVWTSIDIISVSGVQWYALKARTNGGGPYLVNQFVGNLTDSGSQMLTRVRLSDAGVSLVTANVFLPSYTNYGNYIVRGTSFDSPYFALQGDQYTLVEMADRTSGATDVGFIGIYNENTKVIDIPGNSDKVYFNNGGNFLIGTTTDVGAKLYVNGETRATSFTNAGPLGAGSANARNHFTQLNAGNAIPATGWIAAAFGDALADRIVIGQWTNGSQQAIFGAHTGALQDWADVNYVAKNHKFYYNGDWSISPAMTIATSGNVGIGTTSPQDKLEIKSGYLRMYDPSSSVGAGYLLQWSSDNGGSNVTYAGIDAITTSAGARTGDLRFFTSNAGGPTEKMRITGAGNVGIGTTSPDTPLSTSRGIVINSGASNDVQIRMQNNATGSTGSDGGLLSISGSQMYLWNYEASNLIFGTNNSERMRIDSSGNIGIGTTSISYRVDISGDARILSGSLGVGVAPNATDGRIDASNDIVAYSTSDQRLKENVTPIENALEKVKTLTGVEFDWKEETAHVHGYHGHDVGVIAQDVQAVLPEAVRTNDSGYLSVRYEKMIALLIEANKELAARVEELEKKLK